MVIGFVVLRGRVTAFSPALPGKLVSIIDFRVRDLQVGGYEKYKKVSLVFNFMTKKIQLFKKMTTNNIFFIITN